MKLIIILGFLTLLYAASYVMLHVMALQPAKAR